MTEDELREIDDSGDLSPDWALEAYVKASSEPVQTHADEMRMLAQDVLSLRRQRIWLRAEVSNLRAALRGDSAP